MSTMNVHEVRKMQLTFSFTNLMKEELKLKLDQKLPILPSDRFKSVNIIKLV